MKRLVFAVACCASLSAGARTIELNGDLGCSLVWHQAQRVRLSQVVMDGAALKAAGRDTPATRKESDEAAAEIVRISNADCRPLAGKFKVLETRDAPGGKFLRVRQPEGNYLWVIQ